MNLKLFFSHAWADKAGAKVKKLLLLLQKDYEVWLDKKQIDLGNHINDTVAKGIQDCDIFISVWSRNAYDSKGVLFELETAVQFNKPILVLLIEQFDIAHSPHLAGREYIDFSGDALSFSQQEIYLQNFLLRKKAALFTGHFTQPEQQAAMQEINQKTGALQDMLIELEDNIKRQKLQASGNDDSDVYIQSSLNAFEKIQDDNKEGKLMLLFAARMKEISAKYPLQQDDSTKKRLALKAIEELDPLQTNEELNAFKQVLQNDLGLKKNELIVQTTVPTQQLQLLLEAYKTSVAQTRQVVVERSKAVFKKMPALDFLSPFAAASAEYEMSYVTSSPQILEKMLDKAIQTQNREMYMLIAVLIQHIDLADLQKVEESGQIKNYMHYAYLINNTARLLVQAKALQADEISYSMISSIGLDKLSKLFFKEDWKAKSEKFLDMVKDNYGIEDKNLNWIKAAATVVGVVLVADALSDSGSGDAAETSNLVAGAKNAAAKSGYFEDRMASMGFTMPNTVQY